MNKHERLVAWARRIHTNCHPPVGTWERQAVVCMSDLADALEQIIRGPEVPAVAGSGPRDGERP